MDTALSPETHVPASKDAGTVRLGEFPGTRMVRRADDAADYLSVTTRTAGAFTPAAPRASVMAWVRSKYTVQ